MAVSRFCPHGNYRPTCAQCRADVVRDADQRAALNRARGESDTMGRFDNVELPYPWQRSAFDAWRDGGKSGLVALSLGLPTGDLPYAVMGELVNASPTTNVLVACGSGEAAAIRHEASTRFGIRATTLIDHHFLEPRNDGCLVVADLQELETVPLNTWGRFASNGLLVLLDADSVSPGLGQALVETPFRSRFSLSRQPSAIDLLSTRPWSRAFGPLVFRSTEDAARDLGILPRIQYKLHVEMLRPEASEASGRQPGAARGAFRGRGGPQRTPWEDRGPQGPWEPTDVPTRITVGEAGPFIRSRARDVASRRAQETPNLVVLHEGVPVPGAAATLRLADLPDKHADAPAAWLLATPNSDAKAILRLATVAFKTLGKPGAVEDAVVLPVPVDLCRVPPWNEKWRMAANQIDRVVAGLLLAEKPGEAMMPEDLESLVGVALALRGIPQDELYRLTPIVAEAAHHAHAGESISPERVRQVARSLGGLATSLLVAAESGPLHLLRLAHPRFTPVVPDLPHPSLYDARRHAWRGRAFAALAQAAKSDLVTAWGRYPELRFVFPSSALLEAATAYCAKHKLKGPLDDAKLHKIADKTRIPTANRERAMAVLQEWNTALGVAEEHERDFLADMHARQPERERRREGMALTNLRVMERSGDALTLEANDGRFPSTNIAPGSEVALVEAGERQVLCQGLVSKISSRRVTIEFPAGAPRHHLPRAITVNLVFDAKVFEAYHSAVYGAIRALGATQPVDDGPDGLLRAALLGETDAPAEEAQALTGEVLTATQREAINSVLSGGRVRLVHGPPGTGKTHTLVHLAMALAKAGHSVLVTADSNAAVDNLVVGLRRNGALAVRVGHAPNIRDEAAEAARIDPLDAPLFVRWAAEQGIVVATTNYGAFRYIDPKGGMTPFIFDYVIHDEAGQATAPSSLAAVLRGRRLVLAGDPKQLPPTVVSMDAKEAGLDVTLFERIEELTGPGRTRMLATQFRMREPIVAFSNARYYDGRLETAPDAAAQEGLAELPPSSFQHVTGRENERQRNGSISNDFEVDAVAALVERFRPQCREKGWTIAVLTPYQAQREQLRRRLPDIEVNTVDGAQGREWDVVLYSTVRSNPQHRLGFLSDERRLNVAVTRARRNFVLVGDERTLHDSEAFAQLLSSMEKVRIYYPDERRDQPRREPHARAEQGGRDRQPRDGGRGGRGNGPGPRAEAQAPPADGPAVADPYRLGPDGRPLGEGGRRRRRRRGRRGRGGDGPREGEATESAPGGPAEGADASVQMDPPPVRAPQPPRERPTPPEPRTIDFVEPFTAPRPKPRTFTVPSADAAKPAAPDSPAPTAPAPDAPAPRRARGSKPFAAKVVEVEAAPDVVDAPAPAKAKTSRKRATPAASDDAKESTKPTPATLAPGQAAKRGRKATSAKPAPSAAALPLDEAAAKPAKAAKAAPKAAGKAKKAVAPVSDGRCTAVTQAGTRCRNAAVEGTPTCARHA